MSKRCVYLAGFGRSRSGEGERSGLYKPLPILHTATMGVLNYALLGLVFASCPCSAGLPLEPVGCC